MAVRALLRCLAFPCWRRAFPPRGSPSVGTQHAARELAPARGAGHNFPSARGKDESAMRNGAGKIGGSQRAPLLPLPLPKAQAQAQPPWPSRSSFALSSERLRVIERARGDAQVPSVLPPHSHPVRLTCSVPSGLRLTGLAWAASLLPSPGTAQASRMWMWRCAHKVVAALGQGLAITVGAQLAMGQAVLLASERPCSAVDFWGDPNRAAAVEEPGAMPSAPSCPAPPPERRWSSPLAAIALSDRTWHAPLLGSSPAKDMLRTGDGVQGTTGTGPGPGPGPPSKALKQADQQLFAPGGRPRAEVVRSPPGPGLLAQSCPQLAGQGAGVSACHQPRLDATTANGNVSAHVLVLPAASLLTLSRGSLGLSPQKSPLLEPGNFHGQYRTGTRTVRPGTSHLGCAPGPGPGSIALGPMESREQGGSWLSRLKLASDWEVVPVPDTEAVVPAPVTALSPSSLGRGKSSKGEQMTHAQSSSFPSSSLRHSIGQQPSCTGPVNPLSAEPWGSMSRELRRSDSLRDGGERSEGSWVALGGKEASAKAHAHALATGLAPARSPSEKDQYESGQEFSSCGLGFQAVPQPGIMNCHSEGAQLSRSSSPAGSWHAIGKSESTCPSPSPQGRMLGRMPAPQGREEFRLPGVSRWSANNATAKSPRTRSGTGLQQGSKGHSSPHNGSFSPQLPQPSHQRLTVEAYPVCQPIPLHETKAALPCALSWQDPCTALQSSSHSSSAPHSTTCEGLAQSPSRSCMPSCSRPNASVETSRQETMLADRFSGSLPICSPESDVCEAQQVPRGGAEPSSPVALDGDILVLRSALVHSQTRARKSEEAATAAAEHAKLLRESLLREAAHGFSLRQWAQMLEIENRRLSRELNSTPALPCFVPSFTPVPPTWFLPHVHASTHDPALFSGCPRPRATAEGEGPSCSGGHLESVVDESGFQLLLAFALGVTVGVGGSVFIGWFWQQWPNHCQQPQATGA